jgi:antitoxin HigA-1
MTHPGVILKKEWLPKTGLSITDFADKMLISRKNMSLILNGKAGISPLMILKLSKAFSTGEKYWCDLVIKHDISKVSR